MIREFYYLPDLWCLFFSTHIHFTCLLNWFFFFSLCFSLNKKFPSFFSYPLQLASFFRLAQAWFWLVYFLHNAFYRLPTWEFHNIWFFIISFMLVDIFLWNRPNVCFHINFFVFVLIKFFLIFQVHQESVFFYYEVWLD